MSETANPIETGNIYADHVTDLFVQVESFWVDEDGETQVRVRQYRALPITAYNAQGDFKHRLSLHIDDIRDRILDEEIEFVKNE